MHDVTDARGGGYMSFGQSGSSSASEMTGADVFVAFWSERGDPMVVDYKLSAKAQVDHQLLSCSVQYTFRTTMNLRLAIFQRKRSILRALASKFYSATYSSQ